MSSLQVWQILPEDRWQAARTIEQRLTGFEQHLTSCEQDLTGFEQRLTDCWESK